MRGVWFSAPSMGAFLTVGLGCCPLLAWNAPGSILEHRCCLGRPRDLQEFAFLNSSELSSNYPPTLSRCVYLTSVSVSLTGEKP